MTRAVKYSIQTLLYAALILLSVICLLPFLLMLVNATRTGQEIMMSFTLIPGDAVRENWAVVQKNMNIIRGMLNSLFVASVVTVLSGYFSSITAYAFAVYKFKGKNVLFSAILVTMMVPTQLGLLGFYDLVNQMGLIDSYIPLTVTAIASPATVFFLRQYVLSILPPAILEAPRMEGAGELYIFHKIGMPIMMPGIATMSIGTFIGSWNNYLIPLVILSSQKKFTLPVLIGGLRSVKDVFINQGATYLALAISVVPILIAFAFLSRYIISSITAGGVKE